MNVLQWVKGATFCGELLRKQVDVLYAAVKIDCAQRPNPNPLGAGYRAQKDRDAAHCCYPAPMNMRQWMKGAINPSVSTNPVGDSSS
jgi:hypothetical protein